MVELPPEEEETEEKEGEEDEELQSEDGLEAIERMMARREPYDKVVAALDALEVPSERLAMASVAHTRLSAASMYDRPDDEVARLIASYLAVEWVPWRRLSAVLSACITSPDLFRHHVAPLVVESEAIDEKDDSLLEVLKTARQARQRVLGDTDEP